MDLRKMICKKFGGFSFIFRLFRCRQYNRADRICVESGRRARGTCPMTVMVESKCSSKRPGYCNKKHIVEVVYLEKEASKEKVIDTSLGTSEDATRLANLAIPKE